MSHVCVELDNKRRMGLSHLRVVAHATSYSRVAIIDVDANAIPGHASLVLVNQPIRSVVPVVVKLQERARFGFENRAWIPCLCVAKCAIDLCHA